MRFHIGDNNIKDNAQKLLFSVAQQNDIYIRTIFVKKATKTKCVVNLE